MTRRSIFRAFTVVLLFVCIWTVYANVLSDDADVRAKAATLARRYAGCGDKCRISAVKGERGMLSEEIAYDVDGTGRVVVTCHRAFFVAGDYDCTALKK